LDLSSEEENPLAMQKFNRQVFNTQCHRVLGHRSHGLTSLFIPVQFTQVLLHHERARNQTPMTQLVSLGEKFPPHSQAVSAGVLRTT